MTPPFAYKTVIGTYTAPDGTPGAGTLRFIPSSTVTDSSGNVIVPALPISVTLDGSGHFSVALLVTDDPATSPTGWTWVLTELFPPQREVAFQLPSSAGSTVHLADLAPAVTADMSWAYGSLATVLALDARVAAAEATVTAAAGSAAASASSASASASSAAAAAAAASAAPDLQTMIMMGAI